MILKVTKKTKLYSLLLLSQTVYFLKHNLRTNIGFLELSWIFILNETSIIVFAELTIFHYIEIRTTLGKVVWKIAM